MIKIDNVSKVFKTKKEELKVLDSVSLDIKRGEIFGIIGLSGAGKSTLIRILAGLEEQTSGNIYIDGMCSSKLKNDLKFRRKIGFITQTYSLLMQRRIIDNVAFPLELIKVGKEEREKKAMEILEIVGLADKAYDYPKTLSGGQRQRVAIARALITNPPLLLCDEPTSALDSMTTHQILNLLKKINKEFGITIVIISHNMFVVKEVCDKVAVIDKAKILEVATTKEIIKNPKNQMTINLLGEIYQEEVNNGRVNI